uniref:LTI65/LTI78 PGEED repeat domain-containing protein n=1 Tax=Populus trichocarpa TaxID=3694 RepID=A0A3N7G1I2_POPTR
MLQSFDKMNIYDDSKQGEKKNSPVRPRDAQPSMFPTGSHDQFSAEPTPPISINPKENPESGSESIDSLKIKEQPGGDIAEKPSYQSSNTGKTSSATSALADKEKAATNVIASKLGYIERDDNIQEHGVAHEGQNAAKPASSVEYGKKVAATVTEKLTPVYEKVVGLGSTVMSKVYGNTNTSTNTSNEADNMIKGKDKGVSVKDYFVEKLSPGEEDRALAEG